MNEKVCSVEGCTNKHGARGFCATHYARWYRHGDPLKVLHVKGPRRGRDKTVYIKADDGEVFERAAEIYGGSLSRLLSELIHEYVAANSDDYLDEWLRAQHPDYEPSR